MKVMFKKHTKRLIFHSIIFITLILIITNFQFYDNLGNKTNKLDSGSSKETLVITQSPINDTTAPVITFIQPEINNSIIRRKSYTIIANISDENPPLFGNVSVHISNSTDFLFNAKMNYDGGNQWSFNWNNISLYPNRFYEVYIIQILARDSSSDENLGMSGEFYIFLNIPGETPIVFYLFIYLLVICFIFAAIIVYLNRKVLRKFSAKRSEGGEGVYEY